MDERELMRRLLGIEHVVEAVLHWSPALLVRVRLDSMDWDARAAAVAVIDDYAREHVETVTVVGRFDFPEPVEFTNHNSSEALSAHA